MIGSIFERTGSQLYQNGIKELYHERKENEMLFEIQKDIPDFIWRTEIVQ